MSPDPTPPNPAQQQAARAAADKQHSAKEAAAKGVDERLKARDKQVKDSAEREANQQPTPTQRENDLMRVGAMDIDEKEADGSEPQDEHDVRVHTERVNNPYVTREATPGRPARK